MGLSDFLGDVARVVAPVAPLLDFAIPGLGTSIGFAAERFLPEEQPTYQTMPYYPRGYPTAQDIYTDPGGTLRRYVSGGPDEVIQPTNGEYIPETVPVALPAVAGVGGVLRITARLAAALARVAARLGFGALTASTVVRFGGRLYRSLTAFARRHPGVSILSMLAALGMSAQEAAEFIAWGSTRRRRRRGGISGRDIRTTRRTLRRIASVRRALGGGAFSGPRRGGHHHHPRAGVV